MSPSRIHSACFFRIQSVPLSRKESSGLKIPNYHFPGEAIRNANMAAWALLFIHPSIHLLNIYHVPGLLPSPKDSVAILTIRELEFGLHLPWFTKLTTS